MDENCNRVDLIVDHQVIFYMGRLLNGDRQTPGLFGKA